MRFEGKGAIVTGGAGGIGKATAQLLASEGARVLLVDRDRDALAKAAAEVSGEVHAFDADVTDDRSVRDYVERALALFGTVDILFNNAGIEGPVADVTEYPVADFDKVIAVNVRGVFLGLHHALPVMVRQGSGAIVNTGSVASARGLPGSIAYNAAKHAVLGMTRAAAAELGGTGVRVNAVLPGMIDTRMLRTLVTTMADGDTDAGLTAAAAAAPMNRTGSPLEVAAVVAFLASQDASFVNGAGYPVDGGALAVMPNGR
ncbi:SDR family NAD(P)-dependent oxidoreductase [Nocardia fusca]|uniref:SDR family NAD(P)-dependent oxidoreductase n=1 Tax=Nocardia fusca TaxID=941183 RepID=UPI0037B15C73